MTNNRAAVLVLSFGRWIPLTAIAAAVLPVPAFAHHAMDGDTPASFAQGVLSGLAHPVIGPDHLAAMMAIGLLASTFPRGQWLPPAFIGASLLGVVAHLAGATLPLTEPAVALSLYALAVALWLTPNISLGAVVPLFTIGGLVHGYAYGESIIGAETTPLAAYLIGLAIMQWALAMGAFFVAREAQQRERFAALRLASTAGLSLVGAVMLAVATLG